MKIFLSWSGPKSRAFAEQLKPWMEQVLPGTDVWLSSEDIDKGTIWFSEIINELKGCNCGVICLTRENHLAPWINFEAGGMITGLGKTRVGTILLDLDPKELEQPLNQFNGTRLNRVGAWYLVKSLNNANTADRRIKDKVLERTFDKFWPDLDEAYSLLFPDSHRKTIGIADPLHIVPAPTETLFGSSPRSKSKRGRQEEKAHEPSLFNGLVDPEQH